MSQKKEKNLKPTFWQFMLSRVFFVNLFFAMAAFCLISWFTLLFIQNYSRHGDSKTVPDLVGMTTLEAGEILEKSDLEFAIMDSTFDADERPLSIINQDPVPKSKVKSGRKIYITVNMANPPATEMPTIELGTSYISVREILESRGLKIGEVIYKPFEYRDVFLDMKLHGDSKSITPGEKIAKGSKIDLILGNGLGDTKIEIPDLSGLTYLEAVSLIQLKELSLGTIIKSGTIIDMDNAFVYKQNPIYLPGNRLNLGSMIDIWIAQEQMDPFQKADDQQPK